MTEADDAPDDAPDTGAPEASTPATGAPESDEPPAPTTATRLLDLQRVDTEADQLGHRRDRLPEREQLAAASDALQEWERDRSSMRTRMDELTVAIEQAESDAAEIAAHKVRLEAQMKTVIAPREAEALMHEIAGLDERTDELDMRELEALEEQSEIDDRLTEHLRTESALREALGVADSALQRATSEIDAELAGRAEERTSFRSELGEAMLARYDRVRSSSGVAVAQLSGHRCEGCHLDLSAAEVDDVKDEARSSDGVAECPNCGRMLVA
ncbi:zinc ribbon domain-containing protein [Ilumatobacter sp.]|uniref:zinc ribbon domain-containing protein n=1 Tax=Ilumatobacter sp. TaxID=1967498 RepID=UPI003C43EB52